MSRLAIICCLQIVAPKMCRPEFCCPHLKLYLDPTLLNQHTCLLSTVDTSAWSIIVSSFLYAADGSQCLCHSWRCSWIALFDLFLLGYFNLLFVFFPDKERHELHNMISLLSSI